MKLSIISSGSVGNAYILHNDNEALLIECGVNFKAIKAALKFNLSKVVGCIVSHEHGDHAKGINDVLAAGIKVYASAGTHKACGTSNHHCSQIVQAGKMFTVGNFQIMPFDVQHDVNEPFGFLIKHEETGKVLFLTDTYYCAYTFKGLNNIIIEANYCKTIIDQRVKDGANPKFLRDRVLTSHMSLQTCKEMLAANDMTAVNNIVLIHLSDGNSDEKRFVKEVTAQTGKRVIAANAGIVMDFNKDPF